LVENNIQNKMEEYMIQIGKDIRIEANEYKGKFYIHIRRYYEKDGEWLPGAKGIALNESEWKEFLDKYQEICDDVKKEMEYK
jgi:hypothetical protein